MTTNAPSAQRRSPATAAAIYGTAVLGAGSALVVLALASPPLAAVLGIGGVQLAVYRHLRRHLRADDDGPVFVDRLPEAPRGLAPRGTPARADAWLLMEHLASGAAGASLGCGEGRTPITACFAVTSRRASVPLEEFARLSEALSALAKVRRRAPAFGERLRILQYGDSGEIMAEFDGRGLESTPGRLPA